MLARAVVLVAAGGAVLVFRPELVPVVRDGAENVLKPMVAQDVPRLEVFAIGGLLKHEVFGKMGKPRCGRAGRTAYLVIW